MQFDIINIAIAAGVAFIALLAIAIPFFFRVVVDTNTVHIVQSGKRTISYGKGLEGGNTYYDWPEWVPVLGVVVTVLPTSVFSVKLESYSGYDKDRIPFVLDIMAFFRIVDSNVAAQRIDDFDGLIRQLEGIMQGAARSLLGKSDIESVLQERAQFGTTFTEQVDAQLGQWGVATVKTIELMDVRDDKDSHVIKDIMAKKKSEIERQSRVTVAENMRMAQEAEIAAEREVAMRKQEAEREVGVATAEKDRIVNVANQDAVKAAGVAEQQAQQAIQEQAALTKDKEMSVHKVEQVRAAEITKEQQIINAEAARQQTVINAEAAAQQVRLTAEAAMDAQKRNAEGLLAEGAARSESEKLMQLASVTAQTELAAKIGENAGYQNYLVSIKAVELAAEVGKAQAVALQDADVKIIATSGNASDGLHSIGDVFSANGGTKLATMAEAFANTDVGKKIISKLVNGAEVRP